LASYSEETLIKITAIICLTVICVVALLHRIDSVLVGTASAIIGGIAGYHIGKFAKGHEDK
jgi:membrane protein YqaA with SNARE-associated domain